MDHGIFKHWPVICLVAAAGFSAVVLKLAMRPSSASLTAEDQSYEMLRPKTSGPGYDLSGRQIVREVHSIGESSPSHPQMKPNSVPSAQAVANATTAQSAATKAQLEAKARAARAQAEKARAAAKAEAQKKAAEALAATQREAQAFQMKDNSSPAKKSGSDDGKQQPPVAANGNSEPASPASSPDSSSGEDRQRLSPAQWRSRMNGPPSEKNARDFLEAFHAGDVDSATFYQVAQELLTDSAADRQSVGLFLLKQESSAKTFSVLVANYKEQTPEPLKSKVYEVIKSYGEVSKFSILNKVLLASDPRSVHMATEILSQVVANQTTVKTEASGRDSRSPGSTPIAASNFQTFVPTLRRLASSPDASIADKAKSLLESIQAMKPV